MMMIQTAILYKLWHLVLISVVFAAAYPTGPPSSACLNQQPIHVVPKTQFTVYSGTGGDAGFAITVNSSAWTSAGVLTVQLVTLNPANGGFGGFVMKATRASGGYTNSNLGPLLGNFNCVTSAAGVPVKYHSVYAIFGEQNCVSHAAADDNMYQNVTCQWTAPTTNEGPIVFTAAVVVDFEDYQLQIQSQVLPNTAGAPPNAKENDTMSSPPSLSGCGTTKTCALFPAACGERGGCRHGVMMTRRPSGDLLFEVFGTTFDWLAIGFGDDTDMTNVEIFTCGYDPKQKKIVVDFAYSLGETFVIPMYRMDVANVKSMLDTSAPDTMSLPIQPNKIYCQFVRPVDSSIVYYAHNASTMKSTPVTVASLLSGNGKFVTLAQGQNIPNTPNLGKHTHLPLRSSGRFSAAAAPSVMYFSGLEAKVKTHATLMTIFWLLLCGFGIVVARHTRPVLTQQIAKKQLWFLGHTAFMVLGYVVSIAGVIYILVRNQSWEGDSQIHGIIGLIGMGLGLLNIIAGLFRPHPGTKHRPIFNRLHRYNGLLAFVMSGELSSLTLRQKRDYIMLSVVKCRRSGYQRTGIAIWLGATFNSHRPEYRFLAVVVLGIWTALQLIFMVGFELARQKVMHTTRKEMQLSRRYEMRDISGPNSVGSKNPDEQGDPHDTKVKGKQLVHINEAWIAVYGCTFLALAAAFWAGLWVN